MTPGRPSRLAVAVCVGAAGALAALWRFLTFSGFSNDHYVHVARAYQMLGGAWPVRDFVDPGMPATYVASALGRLAIGDTLWAEFTVTVLGFAVGAAATAWCGLRLTRSVVLAMTAVVLQIAISPRTYSSPKMALYGLAGCALAAIARAPSRAAVLWAAGLTAAAFLVRHDHGLYIGLACALTLALRGGRAVERVRHLGVFALALGALLAPWALAVQWVEGLVPYFHTGVEFSRREAEVSLLRFWPAFDLAQPLLAEVNAQAWLYYLFLALPWVCLSAAAWRQWRGLGSGEETALVIGVSALAMAVGRGFVRDPLMARLPDVVVPNGLLLAWVVGISWRPLSRARAASVTLRALTTGLLVATAAATWVVGDVRDKLDDAGLLEDWDAVTSNAGDIAGELSHRQVDVPRTPTRVSAALVPFFRYVERCTARHDRLLVNGAYADVFVAADRGFAGGQVTYQEGFNASVAAQQRIVERLQRESVPLAVLVTSANGVFERDFPIVAAYVRGRFLALAEIPVPDGDSVRVLADGRRARSGTDGPTGWPCFR